MSATLTPWGYSIESDAEIPALLTDAEFDARTASKYDGDTRIAPGISAASMAIRNYCGWHLFPSMSCEFNATFFDRRVTRVGSHVQIQLPARFISAVASVKIGGVSFETFSVDPAGLLRVFGVDFAFIGLHTPIEVKYTAGVSESMAGAIKDVATAQITHAVAQSYGVTSEASGGVSITYNNNWAQGGQAGALSDYAKEILNAYRLQGVY